MANRVRENQNLTLCVTRLLIFDGNFGPATATPQFKVIMRQAKSEYSKIYTLSLCPHTHTHSLYLVSTFPNSFYSHFRAN